MRNLTLKQLRYVEGADRLGSITNAAEEMNISQSSITAAINMLEDSLGHDVFIRTPAKGIRTTATGREAMTLIRRFIYQSRQFEEELSSLGGEAMGTVRLGCYATAAPSFLPAVLQAISEKFPGASIQLFEGNLSRVMEFLEDGDIDLAFTYEDGTSDYCQFTPLFQAPPYAIVSLNDPLAQKESTSLEELIDRPMVLLDLPHTQEYFLRLFQSRKLTPTIAHSSRSSEIVRALVSQGYGFSILNIRPVEYREGYSNYRILPICNQPETPTFGIATLASVNQPRMVRSFIESCLDLRDQGRLKALTVVPK